jgi:hypothetical protein
MRRLSGRLNVIGDVFDLMYLILITSLCSPDTLGLIPALVLGVYSPNSVVDIRRDPKSSYRADTWMPSFQLHIEVHQPTMSPCTNNSQGAASCKLHTCDKSRSPFTPQSPSMTGWSVTSHVSVRWDTKTRCDFQSSRAIHLVASETGYDSRSPIGSHVFRFLSTKQMIASRCCA